LFIGSADRGRLLFSGEDTFVIRLPQSRAKVLASDPHVKSIAPMSLRPSLKR
jgi:hypothetical protein